MSNMNDINMLEGYVRGYKIFIDTCSLLEPHCEKFWTNVIPLVKKYRRPVIVTRSTTAELEKHSKNRKDADLALRASRAIARINELCKDGVVEIFGDSNDGVFADNIYLTVFTRFRLKYNLLLVTQDNHLAMDVTALNNSHSVNVANRIEAKRVNAAGLLEDYFWNSAGSRGSSGAQAPVNPSEKFRLASRVTDIPDTKIHAGAVPAEGDTVFQADRKPVRLTKRLGGGGEADIFSTDTSYVAKIYKSGQMTLRKKAKIELMLTKKISFPGICYPVSMLYNSRNEFVGYLMPVARGIELARSVFLPQILKKKFPGWTKKDTVQLAITILEKIKYLHDRNIIIGDINPSNILFVSPTEVYIVDTDSFQVEGFPCPVGTVNFTAPEIQRKHFESFLRTKGNENFAVATLLFMIMLPGKPPYSQQGGEDPISNIIGMDFPYPAYGVSNKKAPDGPWKFMWSHLTRQMKEDFYDTFAAGGKFSTEDKRLSVDQWLDKFREYHRLLVTGKLGEQDKMSESLFPTRRKKDPNATYVRCKLCGEEADVRYVVQGICPECLKKGEVYKCAGCECKMVYTNRRKLIEGKSRFEYCKDCYARKQAAPFRSLWQSGYRSASGSASSTGSIGSPFSRPAVSPSGYRGAAAMTAASPAAGPVLTVPVSQSPAVSPLQSAVSVPRKARQRGHWASPLSLVMAVALAVVLFIYRWDILGIIITPPKNAGFVFDVIWPMVLLSIPFVIVVGLLDVIFSRIEAKISNRSRSRKHPVLRILLIVLLLGAGAVFAYDAAHPGFIRSVPVWVNQTFHQLTGTATAADPAQADQTGWIIADYLQETDSAPVPAPETRSAARQSSFAKGTASSSGLVFTVEQTGPSTGILTVESGASDSWKFGPWVSHTSTVTLTRADGSTATAEVSTSDMFFKYHTQFFDNGKTFTFHLNFSDQSDESWSKVTFSIVSFMKTRNVSISLK